MASKADRGFKRIAELHNATLEKLLGRGGVTAKSDMATILDKTVATVVDLMQDKTVDADALRWQAENWLRAGAFAGGCGCASSSLAPQLRHQMDRFDDAYDRAKDAKARALLLRPRARGGFAPGGLGTYDERMFDAYKILFAASYDFWAARQTGRSKSATAARSLAPSSHAYTDLKCLARIDFEGAMTGAAAGLVVAWWTGAGVTGGVLAGVVVAAALSSALASLRNDCLRIVERDTSPYPGPAEPGGGEGPLGPLS